MTMGKRSNLPYCCYVRRGDMVSKAKKCAIQGNISHYEMQDKKNTTKAFLAINQCLKIMNLNVTDTIQTYNIPIHHVSSIIIYKNIVVVLH